MLTRYETLKFHEQFKTGEEAEDALENLLIGFPEDVWELDYYIDGHEVDTPEEYFELIGRFERIIPNTQDME